MTNTVNTVEFNPTQTKVKMLKEWTPSQFKDIEKRISRHFALKVNLYFSDGSGMHLARPRNNFKEIDNLLGLAYTSSGIYACYGVCNVAAYFDADKTYQYSYFTIGEDFSTCYAILTDAEENEICIEL